MDGRLIAEISIHAPLAGCDLFRPEAAVSLAHFNPRTPCGVRPLEDWRQAASWSISIHAPLAGCDAAQVLVIGDMCISIHAPLAGCDIGLFEHRQQRGKSFQSTHPLRGATWPLWPERKHHEISIHAPLAGCDWAKVKPGLEKILFQSTHPLRGATFPPFQTCEQVFVFQSTHPLRGATAKTYKENCTFFELADKLSARIAAKKPSAKADRCA